MILVDQLWKAADEMVCYASTTTEHPPNATAKLLREAAVTITEYRRRLENFGDGECPSCIWSQCTAGSDCVACSNPC